MSFSSLFVALLRENADFTSLTAEFHQVLFLFAAGTGFEETDIAVFRFTLGIPGFDDALIPRVVGILGAALILLNHVLDQSSSTPAQVLLHQ